MSSPAIEFLELLRPGGPWTLSACTPDRDKMETCSFSDPVQAQKWIDVYNGERNLYYSVNPGKDANARKKLSKTDIESLTHLHVDIDPAKGEAADEAFRTRALGLLKGYSPAPTCIIYSGGGFNALWQLEWPVELDGTEAAAEDAKLYNLGIEQALKADACHNIDRILRLPGTWNIPGEQKKLKGREKTLAELVVFDKTRIYPIGAFKKGKQKQTPLDSGAQPADVRQIKDLSELDNYNLPARVKTVIALGHDLENPKTTGDTSRSAWLFDMVCQCIRFNVPDSIIYALITDPGWKISESVLDKKGRAETYAWKQINDAHTFAKKGEHAPPAQCDGGDDFQRNDKGIPYCNQNNLDKAINKLGIHLSYDKFAERQIISGLVGYGPTLQDEAVIRMRLMIEKAYKFLPEKTYFQDLVEDRCRMNSFHPVVDYLAGLEWDGVPRIDRWLITYAGAQDTEYVRAVSRLMLLGAVRRVRTPGTKFDEMCVLISPTQGTGKSTALKALCPRDEWFTDDLPLGADSKVIIERLAGKWIVEAAELKGMKNSDVEHLKSFLSRACETARMAWGRISKEYRRQNVFFGTTNAMRFLRDPTGNRRFWPILIALLDANGIMRDRDQLWAEAALRETRGEATRLEERLWKDAGEQQEEHRVDDPIYESLVSALGLTGDPEAVNGVLKSNDVWEILAVPVERRGGHTASMGEAMRQLGWERKRRLISSSGKREAVYMRGNEIELVVSRDANTNQMRVYAARVSERTF